MNYRICSDFDFIIKCFKDDFGKIQYINRVIAVFREGGISSKPENQMLKKMEFSYIIHKHFDILNLQSELLKPSVYGLYKSWLESLLLQNKGITHLLHEHNVKTVAIFGTMKLALLLLEDLKKEHINVAMFLDNNTNKQDKFVSGIPVVCPQQAIEKGHSIDCVIVSVESEKDIEVIERLEEIFNNETRILSWKSLAKGHI
jgi:FlaA1/EpsC-like NDP-sugar epimerase